MAARDCIDAKIAAGTVSRETGERAKNMLEDVQDDAARRGLPQHEYDARVAQRIEADLERARNRRKRMHLIQAQKQTEITQRLSTAPAGQVDKAALAMLEFDPLDKFHGPNVASAEQALRGEAWAIAADVASQFRSKHAGLTHDRTMLPDMLKGLWGEATTPEAKALADSLTAARLYLVRRHNAAGGDIRLRENWGWTQRHDGNLIRDAGKDEWKTFILERLDPSKMTDAAGQPMTLRQLNRMVDAAYDELIGITPRTDAASEFGSPISKRVHHRELVFRDSRAWMEYHERFGGGDVLASIVGEMNRLARDTALIEVLGPYPQATIRTMKEAIDLDRAKSGVGEVGKHDFLEALFDQVSGRGNIASNSVVANTLQTARNLITGARLGSAIIVSMPGDFFTARSTAAFNGLSITRAMREYLKTLNPTNGAHRRQAARLGYVMETWLGDMVAAQRMLGEVTGWLQKAADVPLRMSGLGAHTEAARSAVRVAAVGELTEQASRAWSDVDPLLRTSFERYGINAADWELYRSTPLWTDPETGASFIRVSDIHRAFEDTRISPDERAARHATAAKFHNFVSTEAAHAVLVPTARVRATMFRAKAGTWAGELIRSGMQFKMFSYTLSYLHGARTRAMQGGPWNKVKYAAALAVPMTLGGAFAEQISAFLRGEDAHDMDSTEFWVTSFVRGGGGGAVGDLLVGGIANADRFGSSLGATLAGPLPSQGEKLAETILAIAKGENPTREIRRLAEGFIPGNSLWYFRTWFDRAVKDNLEEALDPKAAQRFRRAENRARKEHGAGTWWRRGEATPRRGPDFSNAVP